MNTERIERIKALLTDRFAPTELEIIDESHLHVGHAGARDGRGHFRIRIVSEAFAGLTPLERHKMIYECLGKMMETEIHALSIQASPVSRTSSTCPD